MTQLCIVVADDSRARLFTVAQPNADGTLTGPRLEEQADLVDPDASERGRDTSSSAKTRSAAASSAHGYPDHRPGHAQEMRRRFAHRIINQLNEFIQQSAITRVVLMAPSQMLGALRERADLILRPDVNRSEFAEEQSWHSTAIIEEALVRHSLLSKRTPVGSYRPHGQDP